MPCTDGGKHYEKLCNALLPSADWRRDPIYQKSRELVVPHMFHTVWHLSIYKNNTEHMIWPRSISLARGLSKRGLVFKHV